MNKQISLGLGTLYLVLISALMLGAGFLIPFSGFNKMVVYEGIIASFSILALVFIRVFTHRPLPYLKPGTITASGKRVRFLLIKDGASWKNTGLSLLVTVTVFLGLFMLMGMKQMGKAFSVSLFVKNIPWILIFAVLNSWSEEIFYRLIPAWLFTQSRNERLYPLISGLIFGAAHWWGNPGGPVGIVMAGILGWILARSVLETKGLFWAMSIHLAQDLVVFGVLFGFGLM